MTDENDPKHSPQRPDKPVFLTKTLFKDFDLPREILSGLDEAGFNHCTPIQASVLPVSLTGGDVAGQAQTGTGKTAAFLVTVFSRLMTLGTGEPGLPSALIIAPTRELALQIYDDAELLGKHTGLTFAQVVGGIDYKKQAQHLAEGPDIVICTPGRIIDYLKQGIFKTSGIKIVVVDEADRLFDLGFTRDMRFILKRLPHYEKRQSMLFSATLSHRVLALTYDYMNLPEFISVTPDETVVEGIEQTLFHVGSKEKLSLLLGLLKNEEWTRLLIFANTKAGVEWLEANLKSNGYPAEGITGDLPQPKRLKLMERFKSGKTSILVATDVASRGIHVEDISHVVNYDLPQDPENYTHRIGRTARAGKTGRAFSFACENCVYFLEPIEKMLGKKIPVLWPEDEWFEEVKSTSPRRGPRPPKRQAAKNKPHAKPLKRPSSNGSRRKIATSSEPGGIFGLAPQSADEKPKGKEEEKAVEKKKRKRPRRKKKASPEKASENNGSEQPSSNPS